MHGAIIAPGATRVQKIKTPNFPQFEFEYHGEAKKVYLVDLGSKKTDDGKYIAEVIAEHCDTEGAAYNFVQTYLRGFRRGKGGEIVAPVK